ncbi:MAG: ABC transporter permease [Gammaproteobacteria bacterium]|nr:ABC transporter permease [Gammaproteobacteria bacterium]
MLVILRTDALVWLLAAVIIFFTLYTRRKPHLLDLWRRVGRKRLAMGALVVLLAYVSVGLLDSIHFRPALEDVKGGNVHYSVEVLSLLDVLIQPVKDAEEKTYSAPFAVHLYVRESVEQEDGSVRREYPRLKYGGAHLQDQAARFADIFSEIWQGFGNGMAICFALVLAVILWRLLSKKSFFLFPRAERLSSKSEKNGRTVLLTAGAVIVLTAIAIHLSCKYHIFGTNKVGQDVFYLAVKSIRTGLVIGTLTTLIMLPFAILLGVMAGYFRGWIDDVIQYTYTTLNSIPGVLLIAAAILMIQVYISNNSELFETAAERADLRLLFLCIILGITNWTGLCRLLRGETLKLREMDYVKAARAFGVWDLKIISRHILPNVMHIILISVVLDFSALVLAEAALSYVGVGVDPSMISWGNMINSARLEMAREPVVWWTLLAAFLFMFTLVLAANLFADAVREAFDPRMN